MQRDVSDLSVYGNSLYRFFYVEFCNIIFTCTFFPQYILIRRDGRFRVCCVYLEQHGVDRSEFNGSL